MDLEHCQYVHCTKRHGPLLAHVLDSLGAVAQHEQMAQIQTVKVLLNAKADARDLDGMTDDYGYTPLMNAVLYGHFHLARYLMDLGADPTRRNAEGVQAFDLFNAKAAGDLRQTFSLRLSNMVGCYLNADTARLVVRLIF